MAKKISITRSHGLGREGAIAKLGELIGDLVQRYGLSVDQSGDRATVKGKGVTGEASIAEDSVSIDLKLGFPASMVAKKIEAGIVKAIDTHFQG